MKRLWMGMAGAAMMAGSIAYAKGPLKIAFVDTGDTGRAVIMETMAKGLIAEKKMPVLVIGRAFDLNPFNITPEPNALVLLKQHGMDASADRAKQLTAQDVKHSDLILTATATHKAGVIALYPAAAGKTFTMAEYATGKSKDVVDAYGKDMPVYEQVYGQIAGYLTPALEKAVAEHH